MKYFFGVLALGAVLGTLAFFNISPFRNAVQQVIIGASNTGSTFANAKFAGIVFNAANGTSTSILNTDSQDRFVTQVAYGCKGIGSSFAPYTGAGISQVNMKIATTSTSHVSDTPTSNTVISNTNLMSSEIFATTTGLGGMTSL